MGVTATTATTATTTTTTAWASHTSEKKTKEEGQEMTQDWTSLAVVDAVWDALRSPRWLARWRELEVASPVHLWVAVSSICRATYRPLKELYAAVDRPYLSATDAPHAIQTVLADYCLRALVRDVHAAGAAAKAAVAVAGGFAAWRLERALDTLRGADGLPRCVRTVTFTRTECTDFWIPNDVDVYVATEDPEAALAAVQAAFLAYAKALWGDEQSCFVFQTLDAATRMGGKADHEDEEGGVDPTIALDALPVTYLDRWHATRRMDLLATEEEEERRFGGGRKVGGRGVEARRMWTLTAHAEGAEAFVPSTCTVWTCRDLAALAQSFLLAHCGVLVDVDDGGEWRFHASARALGALRDRRLLMQRVPTRRSDSYTLARYTYSGFSFTGNQPDGECLLPRNLVMDGGGLSE